MQDDDFKLLRGFGNGQTNERTDIGGCRVAFATEKSIFKDIIQTGGWVVKAFYKKNLMNLFLTLGGGKSFFLIIDPTYLR